MALARTFDPIKRLTQRTRGRLVLLLVVLGVVWLGSAAFAYFALGAFTSFGEAIWSGITHLLDHSSLRDDHDLRHRAVGLFQVIFGLVFLVGLAFTVISEVVGSSLERLGQYDTPGPARRRPPSSPTKRNSGASWSRQPCHR
jgi:hypothetical protein